MVTHTRCLGDPCNCLTRARTVQIGKGEGRGQNAPLTVQRRRVVSEARQRRQRSDQADTCHKKKASGRSRFLLLLLRKEKANHLVVERRLQVALLPVLRCALPKRLGSRRVRVDDACQGRHANPARHAHRDLGDQVACVRSDDGGSKDLVRALGTGDLHKALRHTFALATVDVLQHTLVRCELHPRLLELRLVLADVGDLGLRVRAPRRQEVGLRLVHPQKHVADRRPRLPVGGVGELEGAGDVAAGVDVIVARLEEVVDVHTRLRVVLNACLLQPDAEHVRDAPGGVEHRVGRNGLHPPVLVADLDRVRVPRPLRPHTLASLRRAHDRDLVDGHRQLHLQVRLVVGEVLLHALCGVGVLTHQDLRVVLEDDDLRPEARHGLRHLDADGAGADEHDAGRQLLEVEERHVGEVRHVEEAGDAGHAGAAARGHHRLLVLQRGRGLAAVRHRARHDDTLAALELRVAQEDVLVEVTLVAVDAVVRRNLRPQLPHALHDEREVHRHLGAAAQVHAVLSRRTHLVRTAGTRDEGLRREAADVQAVAAHVVPLDHRHTLAQRLAHDGRQQAGHTRPHHDQVVLVARLGVLPVKRANVLHEKLVGLVRRAHGRCGGAGHVLLAAPAHLDVGVEAQRALARVDRPQDVRHGLATGEDLGRKLGRGSLATLVAHCVCVCESAAQ
eukprot:Rhum_TRINITY_DN21159_c0_g1::Rhum_TRINITY_DN21159_c0_g1_i1::g.173326::m.173326